MKKIDENGFWNYEANPISKVGVFPYLGSQIDESLEPDKVYYVYRPAEELFSEEAIASFNSVPVPLVDDHTMIGKDYTPAEQKGVDGVISNVRQSGDELIGDLAIYSESMKDKINHGKKDLSMGYFCSYDLTPGEWNGQHYDAIQRDIRSNHVALVKDGRCGHSVRVYDSFSIDYSITNDKEQEMKAIDAEFKESDHPRDKDGKFTSGSGSGNANSEGSKWNDLAEKSKSSKQKIEISAGSDDKRKVSLATMQMLKDEKVLNHYPKLSREQENYVDSFPSGRIQESVIKCIKQKDLYDRAMNKIKEYGFSTKDYDAFRDAQHSWEDELMYLDKKWRKKSSNDSQISEDKMNTLDAQFEESKHKRDENGRFTSGGGSGGTSKTKSENPFSKTLKIEGFKKDDGGSYSKTFEDGSIASISRLKLKEGSPAFRVEFLDKDGKHHKKDFYYTDIESVMRRVNKGEGSATKDSQISEQKGVKMKYLKEAKDGDLIVKHDDEEEEKTMDASVDKRELIREIGAIAGQGGLSDELVRTLMQKAEELAYNGSEETQADDACDEDDTEEEIDIKEEEKAEDEDTLEEDKEEEKEVNDEDEDEEEKKDEDLAKSLDAMPKKIMKMIATRDSLVEQLKPIIGSFNYQSKTADQVAKYACDALNLKVSKASDAHACIRGYLAGYKKSQKVYSMDTAATTQVTNNQIEKYLKGE